MRAPVMRRRRWDGRHGVQAVGCWRFCRQWSNRLAGCGAFIVSILSRFCDISMTVASSECAEGFLFPGSGQRRERDVRFSAIEVAVRMRGVA